MIEKSVEERAQWDAAHLAALREQLERAREAVRQNHRKISGLRLAHMYSFSIEQMLLGHIDAVAEFMGAGDLRSGMSVLAVGGFGRNEFGLFSDLDFVFVTESEPSAEEELFLKALLRPLFDLRLDLGYGVHTVRDCLAFLGQDISKVTALLAMRHLWGNEALTEELQERLHARLHKQNKLWFVQELEKEMRGRHASHGDTVFLLEPDVKYSRGGLRDIHQILWIAFALYGASRFEVLLENGVLTPEERMRLDEAWSFLMEVRNSLHLAAKRRVDKLTLERQVHVAKELEFEPTDYALPEELLMRRFYDHALIIERLSQRMLTKILEQTPGTEEARIAAEPPRPVARDFHARGDQIWLEEQELTSLHNDRFWHLKFFVAAARYNLQPREDALRLIEKRLGGIDNGYRRSPVARDYLLTLFETTGTLAKTLRAMHHCGFLSALIPEFQMVRNLPRIDHYHQFTVDEHSLRAVQVAELLLSDHPPQGMEHAAEVAKSLLRVDLLILSLLIHDVGKGEGRGHVIRGMHIAQRIAERMGLRPIEQELLRNLVANHQKMSHMALRRDIEDANVLSELAEAVRDAEQLKMLYVHTACDMMAVSKDSWNDWRARLLALLHDRTMQRLRGLNFEVATARAPIRDLRDAAWEELQTHDRAEQFSRDDIDHFLTDMPQRYLRAVTASDVVEHFLLSTEVNSDNRITFKVSTFEGSSYPEVTFVARSAPGLFSNICGALAAKRFNIRFAQIYTAASGEAIDVFQVEVPESMRGHMNDVLRRICERLNRMLKTGVRERWTDVVDRTSVLITPDRLALNPPRVDIDNDASPDRTVIEVRAPDRPGLLSEIAGVFDKYSVHIDLAFIATESYQLVDVFYVTDMETNKLRDERKLRMLTEDLLETIQVKLPAAPK